MHGLLQAFLGLEEGSSDTYFTLTPLSSEPKRMEPNPCKTSESEEDYVEEEESEEECVQGEATIPSDSPQQELSKADYKEFGDGVPLSIVAKKIPKKIIAPADSDDLEVGRRKRRRKRR